MSTCFFSFLLRQVFSLYGPDWPYLSFLSDWSTGLSALSLQCPSALQVNILFWLSLCFLSYVAMSLNTLFIYASSFKMVETFSMVLPTLF